MNGFERTHAALVGRQTDRPPVMLHNFMMAAKEAGYTMADYRKDPQKIANAFIQSVETYGYDAVMVDVDTVTLAGAVGVPVDFPEHEPARSHLGSLDSLDTVSDLEPVDIRTYEPVQIWLEAVRLLKQHFNNEIFVRGNCDQAPFSLASMMRTPQTWMIDLLMSEEQALPLLEYCTGISEQFIRLMAEAGADMVSNGDSPAGPEMISPDMYERFALPYEKRIIAAAHACGVPYALHICGNTTAILNKMVESGADALELDYRTDSVAARNALKDRAVFIGNIDPSGVIAMGSVADVVKETEKLLDVFSNNPLFILNAGCAIPSTTPFENLKAMIDTVKNR